MNINKVIDLLIVGGVGFGVYKVIQLFTKPSGSSNSNTGNLVSNPLISPVTSAQNTGSSILAGKPIPQANTIQDVLKYISDGFQYISNPFALLGTKIPQTNNSFESKFTSSQLNRIKTGRDVNTGQLVMTPTPKKTTSSLSNISRNAPLTYRPVKIKNKNVNGGVWTSPYGYVSPKDRLNVIKT